MKPITPELLARFRAETEQNAIVRPLQAAMARTELQDLAWVPSAAAKLGGSFEIELKTRGITWQQKSGRCWLFAAMNIMREITAERCNLDAFELSGNYLSFYDKLEKANNVLGMAIENAHLPLDDRMMEYILGGVHDGGYWDMAADLVRKYGVVPSYVMPETYQSDHTEKFMKLYNTLLRKDICILRGLIAKGEDPQRARKEMLSEIYRAECIAFGQPPVTFDFFYTDRDGVYHEDRALTPQDFCRKYVSLALDDYVTITNHPTDGLPLDDYYAFHYIGSMAEGDVRSLNLSMDELEELVLAQLRGGESVWFGCDSGAFGDRKRGIWDPDSLAYEQLLGGADLRMTKKDRLNYHDSYATHAMILTGAGFDAEGKPARWKIENSWGPDVGDKGYFVCSEKYFREYVYEAVINRRYLTDAQRALLEKEPRRIRAWESDWL